jgi:hypothetical protein
MDAVRFKVLFGILGAMGERQIALIFIEDGYCLFMSSPSDHAVIAALALLAE